MKSIFAAIIAVILSIFGGHQAVTHSAPRAALAAAAATVSAQTPGLDPTATSSAPLSTTNQAPDTTIIDNPPTPRVDPPSQPTNGMFAALLTDFAGLLATMRGQDTSSTDQAQLDALQREISETNQINNLSNVTITSPTFSGVTTSNVPEGSNRYYTDGRADARINATSTIGTLLSAPTLTMVGTLSSLLAINATTTNLAVTSTASTSNLVVSNSFTLGNLTGFLKATAGVVSTALVNLTSDVTGILPVANGGTGWSNINTGSLLFGNGGGALATSSNLFWDNSNNRLGIGTTSPSQALSVSGSGYFTGGIGVGNGVVPTTNTVAVPSGGWVGSNGNYNVTFTSGITDINASGAIRANLNDTAVNTSSFGISTGAANGAGTQLFAVTQGGKTEVSNLCDLSGNNCTNGSPLVTVSTTTNAIVIFASGQSNFVNLESYIWTPPSNLLMWNYQMNSQVNGTAFVTPASFLGNVGNVPTMFAAQIAKQNPTREVYLIDISYGGMPIGQWSQGSTNPDMYDLTRNNVTAALAAIPGRTNGPIDIFMWWQGEADAGTTTTAYFNALSNVENGFYTQPWFATSTAELVQCNKWHIDMHQSHARD